MVSLLAHGVDSYRGRVRVSRRVLRGFDPAEFAAIRTNRGWNVSDLARISGVAVSTIHYWEAGTNSPQIDILAKVMDVLGAPIEAVVLIVDECRYPGDWRVMTGMTQPQLAAAAGLSTVKVQRIERADYPLSAADAQRLAAVVGITVEQYRDAYERARTRPPGQPA